MPTDTTPPQEPWSNHPGYDLTRYTLTCHCISDLDRHNPRLVDATVKATKFTDHKNTFVHLDVAAGPAGMQARMSPDNARTLAKALLAAADIVEAFEADRQQAEKEKQALFNAGPVRAIALDGGVIAFETVAEGGAE